MLMKNENLINDKYLELAGTTPGDWYQIGLSRLGVKDNYQGYLAVIKDKVRERYETEEKNSARQRLPNGTEYRLRCLLQAAIQPIWVRIKRKHNKSYCRRNI